MTEHDNMHRKRVRAHYDALADHGPYATLAPQDHGGRKSRYVSTVFDLAILPYLRRERFTRLLDFGSGTGVFAVQAKDYGDEVVGIDVSPAMLLSAQRLADERKQVITFAQTDGTHLPFADNTFDCFVARESICYVPDRSMPAVLDEIHRVLRAGSRLYLLEQVSENPAWQHHPGAPNLQKRSIDAILAMFQRAGFVLDHAKVVRQPRFPWVYPIWMGLVPVGAISFLARLEIAWNKHFCMLRTRRWQNALFVFRKP